MKTPFSGGCACGAIRYSCAAEPLYMGNCHCRDCQRATGSAYFAAVIVKQSDFLSPASLPGLRSRLTAATPWAVGSALRVVPPSC